MRFSKTVVAGLAIFASVGANAAIMGSLGGGMNPPLTLSGPGACTPSCTLGPGVATIVGGTTYMADQPFADIPKTVPVNMFLAAGPSSGSPSTITFTPGVSYVSFLWGSPDSYNLLTVNSSVTGPAVFTVASLGLPGDGNQSFSSFVQFATTLPGEVITSLVLNSSIDAFEVANFSTTRVPEPGSVALFGAGLVGMWLAVRRRKGSAEAANGLSAA